MVPFEGVAMYGGWDNYTNVFMGVNFTQRNFQASFQGNLPSGRGDFYSTGVLVSQERFKAKGELLRSYLTINLEEPFSEEKKEGNSFFSENLTFFEILKAIETAKEDSQILGIIITGKHFAGGWGQAEELRRSLEYFHNESSKPVYAYLESASNKEYYIATAAQSISMPQAGTLELTGLKSEMFFLKGLLDKVGVEADFIHIGKYKSAPEMFTNKEPSPFNEEQVKGIIHGISVELKRAIAHGRRKHDIKAENLDTILNEGFFSAQKAKDKGLIDKVEYFENMKDSILSEKVSEFGWQVKLTDYVKTQFYDDTWGPRPALAVVVMEGDIISGTSRDKGFFSGASIGSDTMVEIIQSIRANRRVEAVVIRINSPGGSGLASDIIWNELRALSAEKKHVVISLGNVAASGGYYIAVGADQIVANQTTLTGSIGVFAGKFSMKGLYAMLGVNKKVYTTHSKGAIFSEADKFSPEERALLKEHLKEFYSLFISRVQRSRANLSRQEVEENAQGHVYTGSEAKKRKMVDHIGGLMLAIELARLKAGLDKDNMDTLIYPNEARDIFSLGNPTRLALPAAVEQAMKLMSTTDHFEDDKIYFMMPYEIEVK